MTRSMTGFASVRQASPWGQLRVEIRALNHRYSECFVRLPDELRFAEAAIRERISAAISRGKVEVSVRLKQDAGDPSSARLQLNHELAGQLSHVAREMNQYFSDAAPARLSDWAAWPGLIGSEEVDPGALAEAIDQCMDQALDELNAFRAREGEKLAATIVERLDALESLASGLRAQLPEIREAQRERLEQRVASLVESSLDPGRLEQEVALILQKLDVDEELDRLAAHISEVRRTLSLRKPKGRRLDFLMQEFNREANTLGSKSVSEAMSRTSVDMKVLIEQMREQIQNIE